MKKVLVFASLFMAVPAAQALVITCCTFEGDVITPSTGAGTASLVGGTTATFATGFSAGRGWNTTTYPSQGTNPKTAGVQFLAATTGYFNITVSWNQRHSNTSANTAVLQYTTDGTTWTDHQTYSFVPAATGTGDTWYSRSADLSSVTGVANNPLFGIRVVSNYDAGTGTYLASRSTSTYGTTGTWRFDDVKVEGVVPEPASIAALSLGLLALARRRRS